MREKWWFGIAEPRSGRAGRVETEAAAANEDRSAASSGVTHFARFKTMNEYEVVKPCLAHF
jgi:hypothetical protein